MNVQLASDASCGDQEDKATAKRGRKYDQVIAGARQVFLRAGFEGAGVDEIARTAGVSKATLYSYFADKRLLFLEVALLECQRQTDEAVVDLDMGRPPREVLTFAADRMMNFLLSPFGRAVFKTIVAETDRFPEIGEAFWKTGPLRGRMILMEYFTRAEARGELEIPDKRLAADQFSELCKADLWPRMMFGIKRDFTEDDRLRVVNGAVDMFMARYGTE
ncbi:MAG: TetR/AcrR family transcriptional regulator [Pseudomonadota bacterium]